MSIWSKPRQGAPAHLATKTATSPHQAVKKPRDTGYLTPIAKTGETPVLRRRGGLADTPRPLPRGKLNEGYVVIVDLVSDLGRLIIWLIAAVGRLIGWTLGLGARGIGWIVQSSTRGKVRQRSAEYIGWALVIVILAGTLLSVGVTQHWSIQRLPFFSNSQHGTIAPYKTPTLSCTQPRAVCTKPSSTLDSQPSISATAILRILTQEHSPAASIAFADALYDLGIQYGINPAYALAFFTFESNCGTKGVAVVSRSLGNIRYTASNSPVKYGNYDGYRSYANWRDGAEDWYWLMRNFYLNRGLRNIFAITPVYAPSTDHNDPKNYASTVYQLVQQWGH